MRLQAVALQSELREHLPALAVANVCFGLQNGNAPALASGRGGAGHHHAPEPFRLDGKLATGQLEIVDTSAGERMRLTISKRAEGLGAVVVIKRPGGKDETIPLLPSKQDQGSYISSVAPEEPHEFDATLRLTAADQEETLAFHMAEPEGHHHLPAEMDPTEPSRKVSE